MSNVIDIDTCRSNQEIMDIEVRFELRNKKGIVRNHILKMGQGHWRPGDEPGDLGFQEGNEYD